MMKRILFFVALASILFACKPNEVCRDKTFSDSYWKQDSGDVFLIRFKFDKDDTIRLDIPALNIHNEPDGTYEFDEGCSGFTRYSLGSHDPLHVSIEKNTGSVIWMRADGQGLSYYHRE